MKTRLLPSALVIAALTAAAPARAGDSAAADALFQQAKSLSEAKKYDEACPKFAASYKLDRALGTLLNLADCETHLGKVASAWAHWGEAVEIAGKTGDNREAFAAKNRAALTKRLPMIQLDVTQGKSTLEVYRDDARIDPAAYGVPLPSDPGAHALTVRRGGEVLDQQSITAAEGETSTVKLDLPAIELAHPPPAPPVLAASSQKTAGIIVTGLGGATVVVASVLGILALTNKGAATPASECFNNFCGGAAIDSIGKARTFATATQWVGLSGLVIGAVGVTLLVTAPSPRLAPPRTGAPSLSIHGWADTTSGGLTLRGAL